jgi:hypothetical protein
MDRGRKPNAVWTGDHKGWFRTRDGWRCEPLTVMDASSRYLLALEATGSTADSEAWPVFERLFEEHGLPDRFRSDNGPPFASAGVTGLTPLAVRFLKLDIVLERIAPGKPQQNGRHERFHLTMLPLAEAPQADRTAQGQAFEAFRHSYNEERPRMRRSPWIRQPSITAPRSAPCQERHPSLTIQPRLRSAVCATMVRSGGMAASSMSRKRWPASRSQPRRPRTANGHSPSMPIRSASSTPGV